VNVYLVPRAQDVDLSSFDGVDSLGMYLNELEHVVYLWFPGYCIFILYIIGIWKSRGKKGMGIKRFDYACVHLNLAKHLGWKYPLTAFPSFM
jgi:hypothetical protein